MYVLSSTKSHPYMILSFKRIFPDFPYIYICVVEYVNILFDQKNMVFWLQVFEHMTAQYSLPDKVINTNYHS